MDQSLPPLTSPHSTANELVPIPNQVAGTETVADATLHLVIEKHKRFYLDTIQVGGLDPAPAVMKRIRAKREEFFGQANLLKPLHNLFWRHIIDTVTLCTFRSDIEGQPAFLEVLIRTREPCFELTSAYERPDLLDPTEPFATQYPDVLISTPARKALLVGRKLNERVILWVSLVSLLVAIIIGIVVGVLARNVGIGIETSAGIIGAIAVVVPLSIWMAKGGQLQRNKTIRRL